MILLIATDWKNEERENWSKEERHREEKQEIERKYFIYNQVGKKSKVRKFKKAREEEGNRG